MKKSVVFLLLFGTVVALNAQVFNTGQTLKPKAISLGIEPAFVVNGDAQFMLFLHGGIGLVKGTDFGIKLGFLKATPMLAVMWNLPWVNTCRHPLERTIGEISASTVLCWEPTPCEKEFVFLEDLTPISILPDTTKTMMETKTRI
jgi:hypothetical protein